MSARIDCDDWDDFLDQNTLDDEYECAYPGKCLMPSPIHTRDECHTVEDMEAYYKEMEGLDGLETR